MGRPSHAVGASRWSRCPPAKFCSIKELATPAEPSLQLGPHDAYVAAVERCQTVVDAHQKYIAGKGDTKCPRSSEPLGWYSHERIGHRICAVSNLPACIEADFPGNQSPMELTLCLVDPSSGSNVSCPQKVRACRGQRT